MKSSNINTRNISGDIINYNLKSILIKIDFIGFFNPYVFLIFLLSPNGSNNYYLFKKIIYNIYNLRTTGIIDNFIYDNILNIGSVKNFNEVVKFDVL